ncbi:MAG: lplJ3 [Bacteroidetes bacterium]|nr:lplJ3 [Bacteroidota bacterium]
MIYILGKSHRPQFNLAMEEYCFRKLAQQDKIFMLWQNEPSIIVGKHQNTLEEINTQYVREQGIHVVRRVSGGGTVYHDLNNLNFTIISNEKNGIGFDLKEFTKPIIETLARLGAIAELSPRNDLRINGKKICGTAQAYVNGRMMFHGCLLFDSDLSALSKGLKEPKEVILSKGVKSVRSEVDNIRPHLSEKISVHEFAGRILETVKQSYPEMTEYHFNEQELALFEKEADGKYSDWEWNYAQSPPFTIEKKTNFTDGEIWVKASVKMGRIVQVELQTPFGELTQLEQTIPGVKYTHEDLKEKLEEIGARKWIPEFSIDELAEAIVR